MEEDGETGFFNCLISKCPDIKEALDWAESKGRHDEVILYEDMVGTKTSGGPPFATLDFLLWGFLNSNLEGEAWNLLESVEGQQGFEVWRKLVKDKIKKSPAERLFLEEKS